MVDGWSFFSFGMLGGILFTIIFLLGLKILDENIHDNDKDDK